MLGTPLLSQPLTLGGGEEYKEAYEITLLSVCPYMYPSSCY
jgi:hypothetical protein